MPGAATPKDLSFERSAPERVLLEPPVTGAADETATAGGGGGGGDAAADVVAGGGGGGGGAAEVVGTTTGAAVVGTTTGAGAVVGTTADDAGSSTKIAGASVGAAGSKYLVTHSVTITNSLFARSRCSMALHSHVRIFQARRQSRLQLTPRRRD